MAAFNIFSRPQAAEQHLADASRDAERRVADLKTLHAEAIAERDRIATERKAVDARIGDLAAQASAASVALDAALAAAELGTGPAVTATRLAEALAGIERLRRTSNGLLAELDRLERLEYTAQERIGQVGIPLDRARTAASGLASENIAFSPTAAAAAEAHARRAEAGLDS